MSVPLPRSLVFGTKGPDVVAIKRALSRAGFMEWGDFTPVYGVGMRSAVHALHKKHGRKPAGYGPRAHADLVRSRVPGKPGQHAFDPIAVRIMEHEYERYHTSPEEIIRDNIVAAWRRMYAMRGSMAYSQNRPFMHGVDMSFQPPHAIDCSGCFTLAHDAANAKSPNVFQGYRLPYDGSGYTGTIQAGGTVCGKYDLEAGDAVLYGFTRYGTPAFPVGSATHVAGWEGDSGQHVYSMGHYPMSHPQYDYRSINCYVHFDVTP